MKLDFSDYVKVPELSMNDIYVLLTIVFFLALVLILLHLTRNWLMRANTLSDGKLPRSRGDLRFDVKIPVTLNAGSFGASFNGEILDISKGGLKLIAPRSEFIRSPRYTLFCEIPAWGIINNQNIKLLVAHKGPDQNDVVMHCRWKGISKDSKREIVHHLLSAAKKEKKA